VIRDTGQNNFEITQDLVENVLEQRRAQSRFQARVKAVKDKVFIAAESFFEGGLANSIVLAAIFKKGYHWEERNRRAIPRRPGQRRGDECLLVLGKVIVCFLLFTALCWVPVVACFIVYSLLFPLMSMIQFYVGDTNAEGKGGLIPLPVLLTVGYCSCVVALVVVGLLYPVGKVRLLTLELTDMKGFPSQFYSDVVVSEVRARFALRRLRASLYKRLWQSLGKHNSREVWKYVTKYSGESLVDPS
jgi:hypothetical protein